MIWNAKEYNEKGSQVYEDAERLRKACSNYMTKTNPAYKISGFQCNPTPLPGDEVKLKADHGRVIEEEREDDEKAGKRGRSGRNSGPTLAIKEIPAPSLPETHHNGVGFSGLNFQLAQEKILTDMISYKEDPEYVASNDTLLNLLTVQQGRLCWIRAISQSSGQTIEGVLSDYTASRLAQANSKTRQRYRWKEGGYWYLGIQALGSIRGRNELPLEKCFSV
jgi:hypothetical protein